MGAFVLSRRAAYVFVKQLESLSEASLALTESPNAQARISWGKNDEIGKLVDAFNTMVERLQQFQLQLETRVQERTNELRYHRDNLQEMVTE